jgi:SAM-dependent methyltransferase
MAWQLVDGWVVFKGVAKTCSDLHHRPATRFLTRQGNCRTHGLRSCGDPGPVPAAGVAAPAAAGGGGVAAAESGGCLGLVSAPGRWNGQQASAYSGRFAATGRPTPCRPALPFETGSFTAATLSMVLHFAEEPAAVIAEAARVLRPGGKAVLVDFAEHEMTSLREDQAHRWLGFDDRNVQKWARDAGLDMTAKRLKGRRIDRGLDAYPSRGTPRRGAATLSRPCAAQHLAVEADERPPKARPNWLPRSKFRDSENSLPMER